MSNLGDLYNKYIALKTERNNIAAELKELRKEVSELSCVNWEKENGWMLPDCGECVVCKSKAIVQPNGTHMWQHEETGRTSNFAEGVNPGRRWFRVSDN